ncbi:MAG: DUF6351 family protein, partial [Hyphomicrobium sp.]
QAQRTDPVPNRKDIEGYQSARWNAAIPEALRYHPATNPGGARPTVFDAAKNIYGVNPKTGAALRPFDNAGVQYGLQALRSRAITVAQFLELNEGVGGFEIDGRGLWRGQPLQRGGDSVEAGHQLGAEELGVVVRHEIEPFGHGGLPGVVGGEAPFRLILAAVQSWPSHRRERRSIARCGPHIPPCCKWCPALYSPPEFGVWSAPRLHSAGLVAM